MPGALRFARPRHAGTGIALEAGSQNAMDDMDLPAAHGRHGRWTGQKRCRLPVTGYARPYCPSSIGVHVVHAVHAPQTGVGAFDIRAVPGMLAECFHDWFFGVFR